MKHKHSRLALDVSNVNTASEQIIRDSKAELLICKVVEGTNFVDATYQEHRNIAAKLGIPFGAYTFLHPDSKGSEAEFFLQHAQLHKENLQPIIDAEVTSEGYRALADRVISCAGALRGLGESKYKLKVDPILYCGAYVYRGMSVANPKIDKLKLRIWEPDYPGVFSRWFPGLAKYRIRIGDGARVCMWQWSDAYKVDGHGYDCSRIFSPIESLLIP